MLDVKGGRGCAVSPEVQQRSLSDSIMCTGDCRDRLGVSGLSRSHWSDRIVQPGVIHGV